MSPVGCRSTAETGEEIIFVNNSEALQSFALEGLIAPKSSQALCVLSRLATILQIEIRSRPSEE
jgi:hypothetical protein